MVEVSYLQNDIGSKRSSHAVVHAELGLGITSLNTSSYIGPDDCRENMAQYEIEIRVREMVWQNANMGTEFIRATRDFAW